MPLADGYAQAPAPPAPMVAIAAAAALAGAARYEESVGAVRRDAVEHPFGAPLATFARGFHGFWVDLCCGRLDAALTGLRGAVAELERDDPFDRLPYVLGMLAVVHEERGEDDARAGGDGRGRARRPTTRRSAATSTTSPPASWRACTRGPGGSPRPSASSTASGPARPGWYRRGRGAHAGDDRRGAGPGRRGGRRSQSRRSTPSAPEAWRTRWRNTARARPGARDRRRHRAGARASRRGARRAPAAGELRAPGRAARRGCTRSTATTRRRVDDVEPGVGGGRGRRRRTSCGASWPRLRAASLWLALERGALRARAGRRRARGAPSPAAARCCRSPATRSPRCGARRSPAVAASGHPDAGARLAELETRPGRRGRGRGARGAGAAGRDAAGARVHACSAASRCAAALTRRRRGVGARGGRAAQRLVRFLLVHRGRAVPEDELFAAFWPEAGRPTPHAAASRSRVSSAARGARPSAPSAADRRRRPHVPPRARPTATRRRRRVRAGRARRARRHRRARARAAARGGGRALGRRAAPGGPLRGLGGRVARSA